MSQSVDINDPALLQQISVWLQPSNICLERMVGGQNNHAFKLIADSKSYFLKRIPEGIPGARERFDREVAFQSMLKHCNTSSYIRLLDTEATNGLLLFEWCEGELVKSASESLTKQALTFLEEINVEPLQGNKMELPSASDAAIHLEDFCLSILNRIRQLRASSDECSALLDNKLVPAFEEARKLVVACNGKKCELGTSFSPSDFGFHNAMMTADSRLLFHDFEYAGIDSTVKMLLDFWAQPRVPIPLAYLRLLSGYSMLESVYLPMSLWEALYKLTKIKWMLIKLNVFLPRRGLLKSNVIGSTLDSLQEQRLSEVSHSLEKLSETTSEFGTIMKELLGSRVV